LVVVILIALTRLHQPIEVAMRKALALAILAAVSLVVGTDAQQAGHNTPVLPGRPLDDLDPQGHLKTDLLQQGQVESSGVVSSRDWSNIIWSFNDYRAVDISDSGTPGGSEIAENRATRPQRFAWAGGRPAQTRRPTRSWAAASSASIGLAFSYDGGNTFTGALLAPIENLEAMSDPRWAAAPCGVAYLATIAYNPGGRSIIAVIKYVDLATPAGDSWKNMGYTIVDDNTNSPTAFHDLPFIIADPARGGNPDPCAHNVYVGWARFGGDNQPVRLNFARSTNGGLTWVRRTIQSPHKTVQGVVIDVDKRPGTPPDGGGRIYYGFRSFTSPINPQSPKMFVAESKDFGNSFSTTVAINTTRIYPFDQPSISTTFDPSGTSLAFRSNAFLTLHSVRVGNFNRLFGAWAERSVMPQNPPTTGSCPAIPDPNGEPRIFYTYSDDHGRTWKPRKALDCGQRDLPGTERPGLGLLPEFRPAGGQFQPFFASGGGKFGMLYYESRNPLTLVNGSLFITGRGNHIDARFALIDPGGAHIKNPPKLAGTNQVSRYPIAFQADLDDGEQLGDIFKVVPGNPGVPAISNRDTEPTRVTGTTPFVGDYISAIPIVSHVPVRNARSGNVVRWKWAINKADVPFQGFRVGFSDSRHQIPADLNDYPNYSPPECPSCNPPIAHPDPAPSCTTAGSRNIDIIHALVDASVAVNAASTFEPLTLIARNFPVSITNGNNVKKVYRLSLVDAAPAGTIASFDQDDGISNTNPALTQILIALFPYSSTTRTVTMKSAAPTASVRVDLLEVTCANADNPAEPCTPVQGGETGSATLNLDPSTPTQASNDETHTPGVKGPGVKGDALNPGVKGPGVKGQALNPGVKGDGVANVLVENPALDEALDSGKEVHRIIDATWEVSNGGTDAASLFSQFQLENAAQLDQFYVFHLLIHRQSAYAKLNPVNCTTENGFLDQVVSSIPMSPLSTNPIINNPGVKGDALNPGVKGNVVTNATFAVAPSDTSSGTTANAAALQSSSLSRSSLNPPDPSLLHTHPPPPPPEAIPHSDIREAYKDGMFVTLRAYQLAPDNQIPEASRFRPDVNPPTLQVDSLIKDTNDGVVTDDTVSAVSDTEAALGTDFQSAGARDLRTTGSGSITLFLPENAEITRAILYWAGPTRSWDPNVNATVGFNDTTITGTNIGISHDNLWGFLNSQAYSADVTELVGPGTQTYDLTNFTKSDETETALALTNGASLLVFYDDGNPQNNVDVYVKDGNDSTCGFAGELTEQTSSFDGWNVSGPPVIVPGERVVRLELHVSDGQNFEGPDDGALLLNGTQFLPAGENFDGRTITPFTDNGLWDVRSFFPSLESVNQNSPNRLTSPHLFDCLAAIVTVFVVETPVVVP
jgi:hypothetical protein